LLQSVPSSTKTVHTTRHQITTHDGLYNPRPPTSSTSPNNHPPNTLYPLLHHNIYQLAPSALPPSDSSADAYQTLPFPYISLLPRPPPHSSNRNRNTINRTIVVNTINRPFGAVFAVYCDTISVYRPCNTVPSAWEGGMVCLSASLMAERR